MRKLSKIGLIVVASIQLTPAVLGAETSTISGGNTGAIPDNTPSGIDITFPMGDLSQINDISIDIEMDHTWVGDLDVTLIAPNGDQHIIFSDTGAVGGNGSGDSSNLDGLYTFGDTIWPINNWWAAAEAAGGGDIIPPGPYLTTAAAGTPNEGQDTFMTPAFRSAYAAGEWVLNVVDDAGGDPGNINAAKLRITEDRDADQISYPFNQNNGASGIYFDVTAKEKAVTILRFDLNLSGTDNVSVYYKTGTYVGFENNATPWINLGERSFSGSTNIPTPYVADSVVVPPNETYGFFAHTPLNAGMRYTNGTGTNEVMQNRDIKVESRTGITGGTPFAGGLNFPRVFNGTIYYLVGEDPSSCYVTRAANGAVISFCL